MILCIFSILEVLRCLKISPWAAHLNDRVLVFVDKQDSPSLILTPIYLIFGIFLPVFLKPIRNSEQRHLYHYAGVLTVGIGDSFAAIIGSKYGRHCWYKSDKSYEGSVALVISQTFFAILIALTEYGCDLSFTRVLRILVASVVCSYAEAKLNQTDNIVLPFLAYFLLW